MKKTIFLLLFKLLFLITVCMIPFFMLTIPHAMQSNKYYWKSTHTAPHIVTGGSRAFRGINPAILKTELKLEGEALNIAFNGVRSPYGDYYNRLIRRKIETDKGNNLFILTVHPGLLSDYKEGKGWLVNSNGV